VAELRADFNDRVKRGQLIARIDPILQSQAFQNAEAGLARAEAQLAQAKEEFERTSSLHDEKIVTETEFNSARTNHALARSNLATARIALERAKQNLAYTSIYAPINGVVIERPFDVGQTVAASLSAPKLFVLANDLRVVSCTVVVIVDNPDGSPAAGDDRHGAVPHWRSDARTHGAQHGAALPAAVRGRGLRRQYACAERHIEHRLGRGVRRYLYGGAELDLRRIMPLWCPSTAVVISRSKASTEEGAFRQDGPQGCRRASLPCAWSPRRRGRALRRRSR
jgi:hypothetical protein